MLNLATVPHEYPKFACRNLDIDLHSVNERVWDETPAGLFSMFEDEIADTVVSYRRGQRWVQTFEPLPLAEASEPIVPLRKSGVYPGLGNIGLNDLQNTWRKQFRRKLVLLTHSEFPRREEWSINGRLREG